MTPSLSKKIAGFFKKKLAFLTKKFKSFGVPISTKFFLKTST